MLFRSIEKTYITEKGTKKSEINNIKPTINGYHGKKEETKRIFKPTPIISPVYGVLDKNYKKDEITSKKKSYEIPVYADTKVCIYVDVVLFV